VAVSFLEFNEILAPPFEIIVLLGTRYGVSGTTSRRCHFFGGDDAYIQVVVRKKLSLADG
jgi:hypothetical protein